MCVAVVPPTPDEIWQWIAIAVIVGTGIFTVVKVMNALEEKYVTRKEFDVLKIELAALTADNARHLKLVEHMNTLTQAVLSTMPQRK